MTLQTIIDWNETMLDAVRAASSAPPVASRAMAMVQTAVFDAVNAANGSTYEGYFTRTSAASGTSEDAAAISASYNVLKSLFPSFGTTLDARYTAAISALGSASGVSAGISLGQQAASNIVQTRSTDGASATRTYTPVNEIGYWETTAPSYSSAALPQWPDVRPWAMFDGEQFRPDGPPLMTDGEYTGDFNQVKEYGAIDSTARSAEQTEIAQFWADGAGTATPPGHWQEIGQTVALSQGLSTLEAARMFALLSIAMADSSIVAWDAKYTYQNWRPITAIARADEDGNPNTSAQVGWTPLLTTPAFPDYVSGHATYSGAAATVLANFFSNDEIEFSTTSDSLTGVTRDFSSFSDAAEEAGISRIYGGIHFQFANEDGREAGGNLANFVSGYYLLTQRILTSGNDVVTASVRQSTRAQAGHDSVTGSSGVDRIYGGAGFDTIKGGAESDLIYGGDALSDAADSGDSIWGGLGEDTIIGNAGNDTLYGESPTEDSLDGGDYIHGGSGIDMIWGGAGDDSLIGSAQADSIQGGLGNDLVVGGNGVVDTALENDTLAGGQGIDTVLGNAGNDIIYGGTGPSDPQDGADLLYGGVGNDTILGNGGADSIAAATGNDVMYGGAGNDVFLIGNNNGRDIIYDFQGAGQNNGDVLHILSNLNGSGYTSAATILLLMDVQGSDAVIWFNPTNNVTVTGGAGLTVNDIVMVSSESF